MKTAGLIILALLIVSVTGAQAQEVSFPLSVEGADVQVQRSPALVIHDVLIPPAKNAPATGLKTQGAPTKNAAYKSTAAGAPSVAPSSQPIVFPSAITSIGGEMGTTGNPKYDAIIAQSAARHGVDPNLIIAVMRQESGFNLRALSYKGATGLMQLMPATARRFGVTNIYDPAQNIEGGTSYLRFLLDKFNGDIKLVLAGYNAGENAVINSGYRIPRYRETQNYVRSITARYDSSKNRVTTTTRNSNPVAPIVETFSKGRLSNNY